MVQKRTFLFLVTMLFPFWVFSQTPSNPFSPFSPLLNKTWKGDFKAPTGEVISTVELKFETLSEGKVVKAIRKTEKNGGWSEHYFYWNDIEKKIAYFSIEKSGVFCNGFVSSSENIITIEGVMTWPQQTNPQVKQSYNFRNTFEQTTDGKLVDRWFMDAFGPWRSGHVIEFVGEN